jgi:hypothetical protein
MMIQADLQFDTGRFYSEGKGERNIDLNRMKLMEANARCFIQDDPYLVSLLQLDDRRRLIEGAQ